MEKREHASLIPFRHTVNGIELYLQKRSNDAKVNPGLFGMFGGGIESGESPEQALAREIHEELSYRPQNPKYVSRFETEKAVFHVFVEEVGSDFESHVHINEGEFGRFLSRSDVLNSQEMSPGAVVVLPQVLRTLLPEL